MCNKAVQIAVDSKWLQVCPKPLLIAGPCGAESEVQVLETAKEITQLPQLSGRISFFRAGVWKPRTRPGEFEGVGGKGLRWLKQVKEMTGLRVMTEVGLPAHVESSLKAGLDALWLGARTTVSPFLMDEMAEALRGSDIPIFVKNPISPDLELWVGAFERLNRAGLRKLVAVHRGFSAVQSAPYRSSPLWEIPRKFKELAPRIPLICDPSHIAGKVEHIGPIASEASDAGIFDGWMLEVHAHPAQAFSDVEQQLTPKELVAFLGRW